MNCWPSIISSKKNEALAHTNAHTQTNQLRGSDTGRHLRPLPPLLLPLHVFSFRPNQSTTPTIPWGLELRNNPAECCCHTRWSSFPSLPCMLPGHLSGPQVLTVSHTHIYYPSPIGALFRESFCSYFIRFCCCALACITFWSVGWSVTPPFTGWIGTKFYTMKSRSTHSSVVLRLVAICNVSMLR